VISIDVQKLVELNANLYTSAAKSSFGDCGNMALQRLLSSIVQIYRRFDPSLRIAPLAMFADGTNSIVLPAEAPRTLHSPATLTHELDDACLARVMANNSLEIYALDESKLIELSRDAIVYYFNNGEEMFLISGVEYRLINPVVGHASVFCKPTFSSLAAALENYRLKAAAHSSCLILKAVWNEDRRWFFKAKPESTMRRSLNQYLQNVLNDAEVRPEQNVDESHPVDIHVTFSFTDQRAIIEIKWLGESVDETGKPTTAYKDSRARDGAKQLAEYLDSSHTWGPGVKTRGYLVVFDGRRRGLSQGVSTLAAADALHFRDAEIAFGRDYSTERPDFNVPVRMYLYPATA